MNLNEAFRFQNAITNCYKRANELLRMPYNVTKTTQTHRRHAANPDAQDEEIEVINEAASKIPADKLIKFLCRMVEEKEKLAAAISVAKASLPYDFDAECALNGIRREAAARLKALNAMEGRTRTIRGSDFKFNVAGDQVPYSYNVDERVELTFNKTEVRAMMKKLADRADEMSKRLDRAEVSTEVLYDAPFDPNDSFEDIVADILGANN